MLASSLHVSEPIGPEQPDFMNAALLASHPAPLADLLRLTRRIEHELGRRRGCIGGPASSTWIFYGPASGRPAMRTFAFLIPSSRTERLPCCPCSTFAQTPSSRQAASPTALFLAGVRSQRIRSVSGPEWCPTMDSGP